MERALGPQLDGWLKAHYFKFGLRWTELAQEESGGLGLGLTIAFALCLLLWWRGGRRRSGRAESAGLAGWQRRAWWTWLAISFAVIGSKLGAGVPRVWRVCAALVSASVIPAVLLTPSRPLVPPRVLIKLARDCRLKPSALERLETTYDVYARRADPFGPIRASWPADEKVIGLVSDGSEPTAGWWMPYGSHRCVYLMSDEAIAAARREGVRYVVVEDSIARRFLHTDTQGWLQAHHATRLREWDLKLLAAGTPEHYTLARFDGG